VILSTDGGKSVFSGKEKQENADFTLQMIVVRALVEKARVLTGSMGRLEGYIFCEDVFDPRRAS
jgi:hypothetical protein